MFLSRESRRFWNDIVKDVILDWYVTGSLKEKSHMTYEENRLHTASEVHNTSCDDICNAFLKLILHHVDMKLQLAAYLGRRFPTDFAGSQKGVAVVFDTFVYANQDNLISQDMSTHSREKADTQMPFHVLDVTSQESSPQNIYVWSPQNPCQAKDVNQKRNVEQDNWHQRKI